MSEETETTGTAETSETTTATETETTETETVDVFQQALEKAYNGEGHFPNKKVIKDENGNLQLVDKTEEEILADGLSDEVKPLYEEKISTLEKYLSDTDWYVSRYSETLKAIPEDVTAQRASAREEISALRVKLEAITE